MATPADLVPEGTTARYLAGVKLVFNGEIRHRGDEVPEAVEFRNLDAYIRTGQIIVFYDAASGAPLPVAGETLDGEWVAAGAGTLVAVFESAKVGALRDLAAELGIDPEGTKPILAARLAMFANVTAPAPAEPLPESA